MTNSDTNYSTLNITRGVGESVKVNNNIFITITQLQGNKVRLCFDAPRNVPIEREERLSRNTPKKNGVLARPNVIYCNKSRYMNKKK